MLGNAKQAVANKTNGASAAKTKKSPTRIQKVFRRVQSKPDSLETIGAGPTSPTLTPAAGAFFGQPLNKIFPQADQLPQPIMDMLLELRAKGPHTVGIFRKSANARQVREIRERIDAAGTRMDWNNVNAVVTAVVFKDFLRSLPDSLLCSGMYDQWLQVAAMDGQEAALEKIKGYRNCVTALVYFCTNFEYFSDLSRLCDRLPSANVTLLRHFLCVLLHIVANSSHNMMSASNLAVCVGPSLLWAPVSTSAASAAALNPALALSAEATASKQVPALVAVLIDKCTLLFGAETVCIFVFCLFTFTQSIKSHEMFWHIFSFPFSHTHRPICWATKHRLPHPLRKLKTVVIVEELLIIPMVSRRADGTVRHPFRNTWPVKDWCNMIPAMKNPTACIASTTVISINFSHMISIFDKYFFLFPSQRMLCVGMIRPSTVWNENFWAMDWNTITTSIRFTWEEIKCLWRTCHAIPDWRCPILSCTRRMKTWKKAVNPRRPDVAPIATSRETQCKCDRVRRLRLRPYPAVRIRPDPCTLCQPSEERRTESNPVLVSIATENSTVGRLATRPSTTIRVRMPFTASCRTMSSTPYPKPLRPSSWARNTNRADRTSRDKTGSDASRTTGSNPAESNSIRLPCRAWCSVVVRRMKVWLTSTNRQICTIIRPITRSRLPIAKVEPQRHLLAVAWHWIVWNCLVVPSLTPISTLMAFVSVKTNRIAGPMGTANRSHPLVPSGRVIQRRTSRQRSSRPRQPTGPTTRAHSAMTIRLRTWAAPTRADPRTTGQSIQPGNRLTEP